MDSAFAGFTKKSPRFPARPRHYGNGRELFVSILGSVATAQGLHYPDDFSSLLESRFDEGEIDEVGNERIRGDENMRAGNENRHEEGCQALKECF